MPCHSGSTPVQRPTPPPGAVASWRGRLEHAELFSTRGVCWWYQAHAPWDPSSQAFHLAELVGALVGALGWCRGVPSAARSELDIS